MASGHTDIEKGVPPSDAPNQALNKPPTQDATLATSLTPTSDADIPYLGWAKKVETFLGLEARGIHRVEASEQTSATTLSFMQIVILWFSINTAAQNVTLASLGQEVFGLGFVDATLTSVFGAFLGSIPAAYTAGWGPWSGNRTLVRWLRAGSAKPQLSQKPFLTFPRFALDTPWDGGLSSSVFY